MLRNKKIERINEQVHLKSSWSGPIMIINNLVVFYNGIIHEILTSEDLTNLLCSILEVCTN